LYGWLVSAAELQAHYRTRSLWLDQLTEPLVPRAQLDGEQNCDVAIVGAGFTGLWAAYYLKTLQPDLRVVVLEREIAGFGPSGRNGGWASGGIAGSASAYGIGSEELRRAVRLTHESVVEVGRIAERERIDCGFVRAGALTLATSTPQWRRLREDAASSGDDDARLLSAAETAQMVQARGLRGGFYTPHAARIDPGRLVRGLAAACERHGVVIYERTAVTEIASGFVRCESGAVRADVVLGATESYTTQLPGRGRRYLPLYSLMIATAPLGDGAWKALGWRDGLLVSDRRFLFFYAQRTSDGRIAIGGRGAPYKLRSPIDAHNERNAAVRDRLVSTLSRVFPEAADTEVTHHWGGPLAVPRDWSMSVTFDPATGLGAAGGYTGHGVVATNISGRTLADLALRRDSELVSMPWVGHRSRQWEPEPLRFLASRAIVATLGGADRHEDQTDTTARRVRLLAPVLPPR
jgi:glycine/D-amino acid oxidase-like deaminating enzyme